MTHQTTVPNIFINGKHIGGEYSVRAFLSNTAGSKDGTEKNRFKRTAKLT